MPDPALGAEAGQAEEVDLDLGRQPAGEVGQEGRGALEHAEEHRLLARRSRRGWPPPARRCAPRDGRRRDHLGHHRSRAARPRSRGALAPEQRGQQVAQGRGHGLLGRAERHGGTGPLARRPGARRRPGGRGARRAIRPARPGGCRPRRSGPAGPRIRIAYASISAVSAMWSGDPMTTPRKLLVAERGVRRAAPRRRGRCRPVFRPSTPGKVPSSRLVFFTSMRRPPGVNLTNLSRVMRVMRGSSMAAAPRRMRSRAEETWPSSSRPLGFSKCVLVMPERGGLLVHEDHEGLHRAGGVLGQGHGRSVVRVAPACRPSGPRRSTPRPRRSSAGRCSPPARRRPGR